MSEKHPADHAALIERLRGEVLQLPRNEAIPDNLQREIRMAFSTARDDCMAGDGGHIIHTRGHALDLLLAIEALTAAPTGERAMREALELARPIVESDLCDAIDHADADWEGMSRTALDAIDAALSTKAPAEQGDEA